MANYLTIKTLLKCYLKEASPIHLKLQPTPFPHIPVLYP